MLAVYISATQFRVEDDLTSEFTAGRRIKADCGVDGIKYSTVQSSSYSSPNTTVTITESVLTANMSAVLYGIINVGAEGSFPDHSHDNTEGHGGQLSFADLTNKSLLTLDDTPAVYSNGKFLKSTTNGFVLDDTPDQTVFSGTEVFVNGDATVTGTVYAHVYDSYSPLTIKDGGTNVIVGNGAGKVDFPNGITVSGSPAVGPRGVHGVMGTQGPGWLSGIGPPSVNDGDLFDYYLDESTGDVYRKDDGTMSSNLITDQDACSSDRGAAANVIIDDSMWNISDPWSTSSEGPWWEYDFGADNDKVVVSVTITQGWGGYTFGPGYIYGSNDGIFYYTLDRFNNGSVWGQTDTMTFVNRTPYRYIRVQYDAEGWHTSTGIAYLSMSYFTDVDWQLSTNIKGSDGATVSGTTSSGGASTFLELTDTPSSYSEGRFLQSTASGIVFATASGIPGPAGADGVDGGNWVLVDSVDVNNSTFSKSVSINGNVDKRMRIDFRFTKSPTSGSDMYTRFNNDSTSNYSYSYITQTSSATSGYTTASDLNLFGGYYGTDEVAGTSNLWLETGGRRLARSEIVLYRLTVTNQAQTIISTRWHDTSTNITSIDVGSTSACTGTIKFYKWQDITEAINTTFVGLDDTPTTYSDGLFAQSTTSGIIWTAISGTGGGDFVQGHAASMSLSTTQSIPTTSYTRVNLDYEDFDVGDIADPDTNHRFNIKQAGRYVITTAWLPNFSCSSTGRIAQTAIYINGEIVSSARAQMSYTGAWYHSIENSGVFNLNEGDYVELYIWHNNSGSSNEGGTAAWIRPRMSIAQMGGLSTAYKPTGKQSIKVEYKSDSEVYINPGSVEINGVEYENSTRTSISGTYTTDTWYYVVATTDSTFTTTSGVPVLDYTKMGYYNNNDRCIGFFLTDVSGNIIPFTIHNSNYSFDNQLTVDGIWADVTEATGLTVDMFTPFGTMYCEVHLFGRGITTTDFYAYTRNPDKSTTSRMIGWSGDSGIYYSNSTFVECSENKQTHFWPIGGDMKIRIYQNGFIIPDYIYTGA
jgi:hypothetical protein